MRIAACLTLNAKRLTLLAVSFLFLVSSLLFIVAPRPAHAVGPSPSPTAECQIPDDATAQQAIDVINKCAIKKNAFDDKVFNLNQIAGTIDSLNTHLLGISLLHPETDEVTAGRGALAATSNLVASLYSKPPASGVQYFAQQIQKFNPVQPAYAQGFGYGALEPVKALWEAFRNIAYLGFVIIFVIMGFMIMFRAHISPQAVATVQDSLPRIVVALILVTFSYAIAGLMIDLMFLGLNVIINALPGTLIDPDTAKGVAFDKSIFGVITSSWGEIFVTTAQAIASFLDTIFDSGGTLIDIIKFLGKWPLAGLAGLIVGIAALFIMFRVFLMLLMAYVMILIMTIASPFYFLIQALPGNNGAKEWFKQMAANLSVFPTVALMIIFAGIVGGIEAFGGKGEGAFGGADSGALKFPLLVGGFEPAAIGKIIALGVLFMTPEAAKMIKEAIGAKGLGGGAGVGGAIGGALGAGAGVAYTGSGARAAVGHVRGAFQSAGQAAQEDRATKLPGFLGSAARKRRELYLGRRPPDDGSGG
ncbi:hypothetical protein A2693_02825 [Candidatus Curtissbacteria bacterium RIFCSPHIGHO2_01_FULL_40_12]|uniref:Uncharacterized protein n=1 Tax=Candidatus Curtissbacteria bacterium RIFCSPHIGHO2_01_FULL_40_12 TaxID=1797710 RepID=A0A1F5GC27_9BACT|nr:MAG: hypothetical protein A2693_02825 [Candidatus Curtissbacteria bacterium RIFCSPHIGHO2_01_FULL_40_12]